MDHYGQEIVDVYNPFMCISIERFAVFPGMGIEGFELRLTQ